jgi:chromosome condensin MukBEF MukE localization factor
MNTNDTPFSAEPDALNSDSAFKQSQSSNEVSQTSYFSELSGSINLAQLSSLTPIYQKLMSGFHITENNLSLWQSLDQHEEQYQALFSALGYKLIKDARGYFYFSTPDTTVTMTKTSRRIALFIYTLIEYWADQGYDPVGALFEQTLSKDVFQKLFDLNTSIFEQIDITKPSEIKSEIIKRMVRLGFAKEVGKEFRLLPPCYRYIDAVLELADYTNDTPISSASEEPSQSDDKE